jgi:hypothetical protein
MFRWRNEPRFSSPVAFAQVVADEPKQAAPNQDTLGQRPPSVQPRPTVTPPRPSAFTRPEATAALDDLTAELTAFADDSSADVDV